MQRRTLLTKRPTNVTQNLIQNKLWEFQPSTQLPVKNLSTLSKIEIKCGGQGFFDPHSSYFRVVVAAPAELVVGGLQLDGGPQSLIENMRVYRKGTEIQRNVMIHQISGLGVELGAFKSRQVVGNVQGNLRRRPPPSPTTSTTVNSTTGFNASVSPGSTDFLSTFQPGLSVTGSLPTQAPTNLTGASSTNLFNIQEQQRNVTSHLSTNNPAYINTTFQSSQSDSEVLSPYVSNFFNSFGSYKNLRAEYLLSNQCGFESTSTLNANCMKLSSKTNQDAYPFNYKIGIPYQVEYPSSKSLKYLKPDQGWYGDSVAIQNDVASTGYSRPYSNQLWSYDPDVIMSNFIPSIGINKGQFLREKMPLRQVELIIAIPSSLFGIFIPTSQHRRIPMQFLNNCAFEISWNKNAFYTTGYCDFCQYDQTGMGVQQQRRYQVTQLSLMLDWYTYKISPNLSQKYLTDYFFAETTCWELLQSNEYSNIQDISGTKQISLPYGLLTELIIMFVSTDYKKYSFCRQSYRLSLNVTSIQARYAGRYYPTTPFVGNGGNVQMADGQGTNNVYMSNLRRSELYDRQFCAVNPENFAVNNRPYDPTNTNSLYSPNTAACLQPGSNDSLLPIFDSPINMDTAMGQSYFHQMRCKGRAAYIIPFNQEIIKGNQTSLSGLQATSGNVMEIVTEIDKKTNFGRGCIMYIYGNFRRQLVVKSNESLEIR